MRDRVMAAHRASLKILEGPTGIGAVLTDLLLHRGHGEEVRAVAWGEPEWRFRPDGHLWWSRTVDLALADTDGEAEARVVLPWLLDGAARAAAAEMALPGGEPLYVGDHDGLYAGRALVPVTQAGRRPGLHLVARPNASRMDDVGLEAAPVTVRAELWPLYGPVAVRPAEPCSGVHPGAHDPAGAVRHALGCASRRWLPTEVAGAVAVELGASVDDDVWAAVAAAAEDPRGRARPATDPADILLRHLGHVLMDVFFEAAGEATRCDRDRNLPTLAHTLTALAERAMREFVARRGRFGALLRADADTDTLARLELRRMVTFQHGTHGQPGRLYGRSDLRQLHPDWSGALCPLQTPESRSIGLVRYLAAGPLVGDRPSGEGAGPDLSQWADLSLSAGLVPFVAHDDPARSAIGAKNLKQAVPLVEPSAPVVRTGVEAVIADEAGVLRAPFAGRVTEVGADSLVLEAAGRRERLGFGPAWPWTSGVVADWRVRVADGDLVRSGTVLATAPDVQLDPDGSAHLALGVDACVALLAWRGLNYEDGIVVSASFAERMTSAHERTFSETLADTDVLVPCVELGAEVTADQPVAEIQRSDGPPVLVRLPESGRFFGVAADGRTVRYRVSRRLEVGDKLSNRHGGKGVVSRIVPDADMPRTASGLVVEVLLNPLGVLRRLNVGQVLEMNVGLLAWLRDRRVEVVARRLGNRAAVATELAALGAPGGRLPLFAADGTPVGPREGVVMGPQYLVKLDHMAVDKLSVRGRGPRSPRTAQPQQATTYRGGRRIGSAQRLGEMELWALQASGATAVLQDALQVRGAAGAPDAGVPQTLRAVDAHLRVAGLRVVLHTTDGRAGDVWSVEPREVVGLDVQPVEAEQPLRVVEFDRQRDLARWSGLSGGASANPLTDGLDHGTGADRERVQWSIPLAVPVPHPWRRRRGESSPLPDLTALPVLPPAFLATRGYRLDRAYLAVCRINGHIAKLQDLATRTDAAERVAAQITVLRRDLERAVREVLGRVTDGPGAETIAARLGGKAGLLRRWLMGRATDFSGRAVIVPDPERDPQTVGLPEAMYRALVVDDGLHDPFADVVVLNRQPSLHPYNLLAFRAVPVAGHALHLPPLVLAALAGDHDGDTVAVHRPVTREARADAWARLRPAAHLVSAATGRSLAKLDLDVALGLMSTTRDAAGRTALSRRLGVPVPEPLAPPALSALVEERWRAAADPDGTVAWLAVLQRAGWEAAAGWGFSVVDLPGLGEGVEVAVALAEAPEGTPLQRLAQADRAGAAGGVGALTQLLSRRGRLPGPNPLLPLPDCPASLLDGLPPDQLQVAAAGGLGRLADKKLMSPVAGAFTKTLAELAYDVAVGRVDCGSTVPERTPLTCADAHPCAACYGPDPETGRPVAPGRRVGLLAATVIGERGTQLSMKTFHGGGSAHQVGHDLTRLRALLGDGSSVDLAATTGHARLGDLLAGLPRNLDGEELHHRLWCVVVLAADLLGGAVGTQHLAVIVRQLWETARRTPRPLTGLARAAERRGRSSFEVATQRGALTSLLVPPTAPVGGTPASPRTAILLGVTR